MVSCWDVIGVSCSWVWEERVKRGGESCIVFVLLGGRQSDGRNQLNPLLHIYYIVFPGSVEADVNHGDRLPTEGRASPRVPRRPAMYRPVQSSPSV